MTNEKYQQTIDVLGRELKDKDWVVIPHESKRQLMVAQIVGFTEFKVKIKYLNKTHITYIDKHTEKLCKIEEADVMFSQLKNPK